VLEQLFPVLRPAFVPAGFCLSNPTSVGRVDGHRTGCFLCEIGRLIAASHAETRTEETTESTKDTESEGEEEGLRILDPKPSFLSGLCVLRVLW
jgi:hypothetical protein